MIFVLHNFVCMIYLVKCLTGSFRLSFVHAEYNSDACKEYWDKTVQELLHHVPTNISRGLFLNTDWEAIGHTPMWLRVLDNKLYCIRHPKISKVKLRLKIYRALHYINRVNRILKTKTLPNYTEWVTHHSDFTKVPLSALNMPPIFGVSGNKEFRDIAGIPFMSFTDRLSEQESKALMSQRMGKSFEYLWSKKIESAFFRGSLSDCDLALFEDASEAVRFCSRVKLILEANTKREPLLSGISTTSNLKSGKFSQVSELRLCERCHSDSLNGEGFARELLKHKYLLHLPGAGNWSRRLGGLLRTGGLIFQSESPGYQFYELGLKPGSHYVPFYIRRDESGIGNLMSRLIWAKDNDNIAKRIAKRSDSFGQSCLQESSIDYFVHELLLKYSSRLYGELKKFQAVDLSSCIQTHAGQSIARLCQNTIKSCWK